jgi:hypothetical protein
VVRLARNRIRRHIPKGSLPCESDPGGLWLGPTGGDKEWVTWAQMEEIAKRAMAQWDSLPPQMKPIYQRRWDKHYAEA